ncbi:MAG: hypothetical protein ABR568_07095 [Pyrinomonadaceae bacterium]
MKSIVTTNVLIVCLALGWASSVQAQENPNSVPLTNEAIVKLSRAGFKETTIISIIVARPPHFDLSPDRMIELKRSGVTEKIILAMLSRQEGMDMGDDSWSNDPFFNKGGVSDTNDPAKSQTPGDGASADIFGSSGGVKGETRSRGGNGSMSGDTVTTGTATVRIIRPPSEANAPMKLEKTRSLTNASVMELVEAGFSEGTIIRRIEQSPVEFDLSPNHLIELRKHRVSEKILAAMKTATGEDSSPAKNPPGSDGTPKN